jgi:hypothetical protein
LKNEIRAIVDFDANFNGNYGGAPLVQEANGNFVPLFNSPTLNFGERSFSRELGDLLGQ